MQLNYLDFDYSEDEEGTGSWDALASVSSDRLPALIEEVQQLLRWAQRAFAGQRGPLEDGGDWDLELQAQTDDGQLLSLHYNEETGCLQIFAQPGQRTALSLTLSASAAFSQALRERFALQ